MDLAGAQAELAARGFDYLPAARMTTMLNNAKNTFEDYWAWPWLEQAPTGPAPLVVPGLKTVLYVRDSDRGVELPGIDPRDIDGLTLPGTRPSCWWLDGPAGGTDDVTINTWPVSPVTLEARVTVESPELAQPIDTPLIPARYHPLWIDLAACDAYRDSDNFPAAQALRGDVNARLGDLVTRYETRNRQNSQTILIRAGSLDD